MKMDSAGVWIHMTTVPGTVKPTQGGMCNKFFGRYGIQISITPGQLTSANAQLALFADWHRLQVRGR